MSLLVAFEGPSLAGKTTIIAEAVSELAAHQVNAVVVPCYAEVARVIGRTPVQVRPTSPFEQLLSVAEHIGIEAIRRQTIPTDAEIVVLDRSLWTCLAHTWALASIGVCDARQLVFTAPFIDCITPLLPSTVMYLDANPEDLEARSSTRHDLPELLIESSFVAAFRTYFSNDDPRRQTAWIAAGGSVSEKTRRVVRILLEMIK